jgi:hypothetical protein
MTTPTTTPSAPEHLPKSGTAATAVFVCVALIVLVGWAVPPGWNYVVIIALMIAITLILGTTVVGRTFGALINEQNIMSLSRFQMVVWTIVVIGAYFAYALARLKAGSEAYADPLAVAIDWRLWALMGISTTSFVGSALILQNKKDQDPDPTATVKTAQTLGEAPAEVEANRQGLLYANNSKRDARFTDMFQGDEVGNTSHVDLAKLQMFYFTVISVVAFVVIVARSLWGNNLDALPQLPDGLIALLGISHAGYLTGKTVNKTPVQSPTP